MKKLLLIAPDSIHTFNFLQLIEGSFEEVFLITSGKSFDYKVKNEILYFGLRNPFKWFTTINQIKNIYSKFKPDLVHVHQANSFAFYSLHALKKRYVPLILTAWGSDILLNSQRGFPLANILKYNLSHADFFTSDSKYMASKMVQIANRKLDITIANFGFVPYPVECQKENIIYSNRSHTPLYRINSIIQSFHLFIKKSTGWKLVIAGHGKDTELLKKLCLDLNIEDKVLFVGFVNSKENAVWYQRSKIFVSVPESDATSISLLEAMYYGCIPVLSDLPANHEWVTDGYNGCIVNNLDSEFITPALSLNPVTVQTINQKFMNEAGTNSANKKIFIDLYHRVLNEN